MNADLFLTFVTFSDLNKTVVGAHARRVDTMKFPSI